MWEPVNPEAHPLHENEGVECCAYHGCDEAALSKLVQTGRRVACEMRFDVQADENGKVVAVAVKPVLGRKQRPYKLCF